jgi:eukaryotic-like serine/threonine-protein kinase
MFRAIDIERRAWDAAWSRDARTSVSRTRDVLLNGPVRVSLWAAAGALLATGWVRHLAAAEADLGASLAALAQIGAQAVVFSGVVIFWSRVARAYRDAARPSTLGPYTLGAKLGEGGMGIVYEARHALSQRATAVKLLKPGRTSEECVRRFEREAQLTSRLTHPNTVSVYDFGRSDEGTFYYAMEYLNGVDLQTLVEREGPQPPARVAHWLAQLCGALGEAHAIGLLHRDVKPANIMVCEQGGSPDVIKLVDFGLSDDRDSRELAAAQGRTEIVGTPLYLSPESITSPEALDDRSDLYAVGAVGYFLLTGTPPFAGRDFVSVCAQQLHEPPLPPSQRVGAAIPAELERMILRCLAKSPDERPVSAAVLEAELSSLAA